MCDTSRKSTFMNDYEHLRTSCVRLARWGTSVTAVLQANRLSTTEGQGTARRAITFVRPCLANDFGLIFLLTGIGIMAGTAGSETVSWNKGADAWHVLHEELHIARDGGAGAGGGDANTIFAAIPQADDWLEEMTVAFW